MRIALLHPDSPTAEGSGAVHSATLIGESLQSLGHEVVFYCPGEVDNNYSKVDTKELTVDPSLVKNKYSKINKEIVNLEKDFASFDIFHSYLMRTIPSVGEVSTNQPVNTVVTLNAYGALCPKNDLMYKNEETCNSNGALRCANCVYDSMRELPPKPDRGVTYRGGRILHHTIKNMKNYPIIFESEKYRKNIDAFQALSGHVKKTYSDFGFPGKNIKTIPNILDERFEVEHKSNFSDPIQLLYIGDLKKHKGVDRLPTILCELNKRGDRNFELSVVGKGPLKEYLIKETSNKNMSEMITFKGFISYGDLPAIYANHDLFVYPGRWQEPFGRVFLESLAAGTPVISTNVGSVSEIVGDGGEVRDGIDEIIDLILALSGDQLQKYSEKSVYEANKFKKSTVVDEIDSLYRNIL